MPVGAFCAFLGFCRLVRYFTLFLRHANFIGKFALPKPEISPEEEQAERERRALERREHKREMNKARLRRFHEKRRAMKAAEQAAREADAKKDK